MSTGYYLLDYNPGTPQYTFPRRGGHNPSGTVIIHTAECIADNIGEDLAAEGCANMIANRADWGSYHCLCDSDSRINMAPWEYEVWGDTETNNWAVHISAALRTTDWLTMPADRADRVYWNMASCAADFVRYMKLSYGVNVPLVKITGAQARAGVPGFCAHGDSGISRSDPGRDFDWARFFDYTQKLLDGNSPEEDELSEAQVNALRADLFHVFDRLIKEIPGLSADAVFRKELPYAHPETAEITGQPTTLGTMVVYNDFQHSASRRQFAEAIAGSVHAIVEAVKAAPDGEAGNAADAAYAEFLEKLNNFELTLSAAPSNGIIDLGEVKAIEPITSTAPNP